MTHSLWTGRSFMFRPIANTVLGAALAALIGAVNLGCPPRNDTTPPGPVTNFAATGGDAEVVLQWANPSDSDLAGVRIQRKAGEAPNSPSDGTMIFEGTGTTHTDTTAANGTEYFYAAYAYDNVRNYAVVARASATPTSATAEAEVLGDFDELGEKVEDVPDDVLSVNQRGILIGLLRDAETLYRAGDPCGSSGKIRTLLETLQGYRTGNAVPTTEDLYNDSRMLRYDMLLAFEGKGNCPDAARIGIESEATPDVATNETLVAGGLFSEPILRTAIVEHDDGGGMVEETFTQVDIPGTDGVLGDPGKPAVPVFRTLIAAPRGSRVVLKISDKAFDVAESIQMNLFPTQEQPVDQEIDPEFADRPFVKDPGTYASDDPYPLERATVQFVGDARDMQLYLLEVASGQYHPASNTFELFENMNVETEFVGGTGAFVTQASLDPFESGTPVYVNSVLNRNVVLSHVSEFLAPRVFGEEFMILTHPDFTAAATILRDHKRANGIWTNVFECGTGSGIVGRTTKEEIDAFIKNHYDAVAVRPSYILLLGDAEFIAPFYINSIGTDWPYAILGNVGTDLIPDFGLGRIPVDTLEQANTVINKVIAYENTPPAGAAFYSNAAVASQFQCCRTDVMNVGTDQRSFIRVSEFGRNVMANDGKTVQRIYTETVDGAYGGSITPRRYYNGTLLPAAIGAGSGFSYDGDTADIVAAYNAGRFLIMHRDHGWEGGWAHPLFDSGDIDSLTNGALQPVVFSVNCASGFFDNETAGGAYGTTVAGVYFAEKLLRKANGGAVGILGDTRNSPSWPNSTLTQGFFDAIWPNALPSYGGASARRRLGDMLNHGKLYLCSKVGFEVMGVTIDGASATNELYLWHCLGDPTMKIRTSQPYIITLPGTLVFQFVNTGVHVDYEQEEAEITVFEGSGPVEESQPIGRGVIRNGAAVISFVREHNPQLPLQFVASLDESIAEQPVGLPAVQ